MLHFLSRFYTKWGLSLSVAHLDHGLRPDSADDAQWLAAHCQERGLRCLVQRLEIERSATQSSWEARARSARYAALHKLAKGIQADSILTAHSATDQFETVVMRFIRGGVSGLGGIAAKQRMQGHQLIRPFLAVKRSEIQAYAEHHGLQWREDHSNQDMRFFRNRVRQQLGPQLLEENPALEDNLVGQTQIWQDEQNWLRHRAQEVFRQRADLEPGQCRIPCAALIELHPALERLVLKLMLEHCSGEWKRFGYRNIEDLRQLIRGPGGKEIELPQRLKVKKEKGTLCCWRSLEN